MRLRQWTASLVLVAVVVGGIGALAYWKIASIQAAAAAGAHQPEQSESVAAAPATPRQHRRTTTSIGTVLALRSVMLRNEQPGTVREVNLVPGRIVEAGAVLVKLDVAVEEAELKALEAQRTLAQTVLERAMRLRQNNSATEEDLDRARAERDVADAQSARTRAVIERKTVRAPFKARIGLADIHPGQYLSEGYNLTTLQGVDDAVHVDFSVNQHVAAGLTVGEPVEILPSALTPLLSAKVVAVDARVDQATRNAMVRARIEKAPPTMSPGASVRVRVPVGPPMTVLAVPATAVRKGAAGDHVFVLEADKEGKQRARQRKVESGALLSDEILIYGGLKPGEVVAAAGSFKLREGMPVAIIPDSSPEKAAAGPAPTAR